MNLEHLILSESKKELEKKVHKKEGLKKVQTHVDRSVSKNRIQLKKLQKANARTIHKVKNKYP